MDKEEWYCDLEPHVYKALRPDSPVDLYRFDVIPILGQDTFTRINAQYIRGATTMVRDLFPFSETEEEKKKAKQAAKRDIEREYADVE
jgi:hypothetical protein